MVMSLKAAIGIIVTVQEQRLYIIGDDTHYAFAIVYSKAEKIFLLHNNNGID
jgi:hypothetical protein